MTNMKLIRHPQKKYFVSDVFPTSIVIITAKLACINDETRYGSLLWPLKYKAQALIGMRNK
jgi:hypothetical protein